MALLTVLLSVLLAVQHVSGLYPVTGATGQIYPRYEIRYLIQNRSKQFSLFIQALRALQNAPTSDLGSYYQISGIHGLPNAVWDGVSGSGGGIGYCTHNMNIFPTWHRPYLALIEQQIVAYAKNIAQLTPAFVRASWVSEANQLRLPYYDWILPTGSATAYPDVFYYSTVTIETPSGNQVVSNPLFAYTFPNTIPGSSPPYSTWPTTLRWPTSTASTASSRNNLVRSTIDGNRNTQRSGIYQMFVQCSDFAYLSSQPQNNPPLPWCPTSLEAFHGNYHVFIGGFQYPYGHMSQVPYAAFDPIFWLHHAMVDRLFAMWQVLYPNSWAVNQVAGSNTMTIPVGSTVGPTSPLTPFRNTAGQFWTSDTVRNVQTFAYTYDDLSYAAGSIGAMQQRVNTLYGPPVVVNPSPPIVSQYAINLVSTKYGLNGPYGVYIFFGNPSSTDPSTYSYDPKLVGSYGIWGSPDKSGNAFNATGLVTLTEALQSARESGNGPSSLDQSAVIPYLRQNLQWRIVKDGKEIPPQSVPNFLATVVTSQRSELTSESQGFPRWDSFKTLPEVTSGKPGGYSGQ